MGTAGVLRSRGSVEEGAEGQACVDGWMCVAPACERLDGIMFHPAKRQVKLCSLVNNI